MIPFHSTNVNNNASFTCQGLMSSFAFYGLSISGVNGDYIVNEVLDVLPRIPSPFGSTGTLF